MLEEILKAALTKDQLEAGLSLSDEEHFLLLRGKGGTILSVFGIPTIQTIRKEADKHFNHEGLWCPYLDNQPCQSGWCNRCDIYLRC